MKHWYTEPFQQMSLDCVNYLQVEFLMVLISFVHTRLLVQLTSEKLLEMAQLMN